MRATARELSAEARGLDVSEAVPFTQAEVDTLLPRVDLLVGRSLEFLAGVSARFPPDAPLSPRVGRNFASQLVVAVSEGHDVGAVANLVHAELTKSHGKLVSALVASPERRLKECRRVIGAIESGLAAVEIAIRRAGERARNEDDEVTARMPVGAAVGGRASRGPAAR
ncbi:MAG TPA: hypothetical protein VGQ57_14295 [Polyangiaceae bacterium]|nr:hypothetical protein [Polyangiaceae bacterium]